MNKYKIDWLNENVGLSFAPGKKAPSILGKSQWDRDLSEDLKIIKESGISLVITLMTFNEMRTFGIHNLGPEINKLGIEWIHLSIEDGGIPTSNADVRALIGLIKAKIYNNKKVLIHCRGGLGRTGTIAGCYLVSSGVSLDTAYQMLINTRGIKCPENEIQRKFIAGFANEYIRCGLRSEASCS
jgi:protein-tyrosine phosphatase